MQPMYSRSMIDQNKLQQQQLQQHQQQQLQLQQQQQQRNSIELLKHISNSAFLLADNTTRKLL